MSKEQVVRLMVENYQWNCPECDCHVTEYVEDVHDSEDCTVTCPYCFNQFHIVFPHEEPL